jgi:hypothetical protein
MSKQRVARAIRRGARYALERHARNVKPAPLELPRDEVRRRLPRHLLPLLLAVGIAIAARYCRAEDSFATDVLTWSPFEPGDLFFGVALGVVFCVGVLICAEVGSLIGSLIAYLLRKVWP